MQTIHPRTKLARVPLSFAAASIRKAASRILLAICLATATKEGAAQTFTFSGCNGVSAIASITGNLTAQAPTNFTTTVGGMIQSYTTYAYTFTGNYSLTPGASTSGFGSAAIVFYNPGTPSATTTFGIQTAATGVGTLTPVLGWRVQLQGAGTLLTQGAFPTSLPPLSAWTVPGLMPSPTSGDFIGLMGGNPTYFLSCADSTGSGGGGNNSNTVSTQTLGNSNLPGGCNCGDPINIATGNLYETAVDYTAGGQNTLSFARHYNSMASPATFATSLGSNWRSNYDRYLRISTTSVIAERPDGQQVTFTSSGGAWTTDTDIDLALVNSGSTWTLTDRQDTVETFTASSATEGILQSIKSRNGYTQSLHYNSSNQLTNVTDSFQRQLVLAYVNGLLQTVTTPDGLVLTYGLSAGNLTMVSYSTTPVTSLKYVYENSALPSALTGVVDENGSRYATWTYDSAGRALTSQHPGGAGLTTVVYNDTDGSRTVTNELGNQETYKFTTLQGVAKVTEVDRLASSTTAAAQSFYTYDTNGYLASRTDWNGNVTNYLNDAHGQATTITEAVGTPQSRSTTISYLPAFHLPAQIVTQGFSASFTYDSAGELLTKTFTDTTSNSTRTWTYTWSNFLEASAKSPRTDVSALTKFGYDASGALTSVTNALNQTVQITAHLPGGLPQTVVDPNGVTLNLAYDARQRLLSSAVATSSGILTSRYTYDAAGNLVTTSLPDGSSFTDSYDGAHRLTGLTDQLGDVIAYTLDALGDRTQVAALNGSTPQMKRTGVFDPLGRVLQSVGGANQITSYTYDSKGNALTITDPLKHVTQQSFDALNRPVKRTNAAGGIATVVYDAHNRVISATDPNGAVTTYTYDGFGDLIQQVSPASGTTTYRYDSSGNLSQKTDARGVVANYTFDALNRLISVTYPGNSAENITYTYDQSGHGFSTGRLTSVTDAAGALSRSYDERGNLLSESRMHGSATLVTTYSYDAASRLASITYPSQWSVAYTRDATGRIATAAGTAPGGGVPQSLVSAVTYQPFGPIKSLTHGNGIMEDRSFDPDYRLTNLTAAGNSPLQNLTYGYDAAGNVLSIGDGITSGNNQGLGYDALNRLINAAGAYGSLAYSYDANGNRLTQGGTSASDGLGSVSGFTYNQSGRLATVSAGAQLLTQYTYDAFGHRAAKAGSITATTVYQYGSDGALLEETDGQGNAQVDYVYLNGLAIATIEPSNSKIYLLHDDRLGTPQMATDSTQAVVWSTTYQPFGQISSSPTGIVQALRLPGQETDLETGLDHNGFRDYAPAWGRYLQSDPIGLAGGLNTYAYVGGNPLRYADPFGLCSVTDSLAAAFSNLTSAASDLSQMVGAEAQQLATTTVNLVDPYVTAASGLAKWVGASDPISPGWGYFSAATNISNFGDDPTVVNGLSAASSLINAYAPEIQAAALSLARAYPALAGLPGIGQAIIVANGAYSVGSAIGDIVATAIYAAAVSHYGGVTGLVNATAPIYNAASALQYAYTHWNGIAIDPGTGAIFLR